MSVPQNFRSAFNGFNREDVVKYIEYINAKHTAEINHLTSDVDYLQAQLETSVSQREAIAALEAERDDLKAQLEAMAARVAELEAGRDDLKAQLEIERASVPETPAAVSVVDPSAELEAYRRAERTERKAKEHAELIYHQVNGVLAEGAMKVEGVASQIGGMADQVMSQLTQLQVAVANSKKALNEVATTMYTIRSND